MDDKSEILVFLLLSNTWHLAKPEGCDEKVISAITEYCQKLPEIPFPDLDILDDADFSGETVSAYYTISLIDD